MKNLKTFEAFGMQRDNCDRCGESTNGTTTMSRFNEHVICMDCEKEERNHPDYKAAIDIENEEIRKGNYNFKGAFPNHKPLPKGLL